FCSMEKVKLALVGSGNIAQIVHIPILQKMKDVEIVAIVDPDRRKAQAVAQRIGIPRYFTDIDDLLASPLANEITAVDICTPTDAHKVPAMAALAAGKDVLVEKPIARTVKEAKEIVDCAKKYGGKLMVG